MIKKISYPRVFMPQSDPEYQRKAHIPQKGKLGVNLLEIGIKFGFIIAVPLILFIGIGLYIDKTYHTVPLFILLGVFLALLLSTIALAVTIRSIFKEINYTMKK